MVMNWWLVGVGLFVHLVFFYSIFDIYFTSPLVHGMSPHRPAVSPPANRLVLFVTDGLRADRVFELDENRESRAPYLRNIIENQGAWGVSHTRVPTESRPGHVAIIAGFYEDVSAVAKGWKENPVEFDSLFNESRYTWSWGSPDILPMFSKGATGDHVSTHMYPAESEDFAGSNLSQLDTWVFDNVKGMFEAARDNETLRTMLHEDRIVLFLHLLGLDTNGHAHRPYSKEYLENIRIVDDEIRRLVAVMDEFYGNDNKTSHILTSDHGMTPWGSHGAGHPSETQTPVISWGAGIRHPETPAPGDTYFDGLEEEWNLTHLKRVDVNQADLCPLMSSLIGTSYPLNSVGMLPLDYLDGTDQYKAEVIFTNAKQIVAQFEVKMASKKETTLSLMFTPFKDLTLIKLSMKQRYIQQLIDEEKFLEAIGQAQHLIRLALEGLTYYHNYDRLFLGVSIAFGFTGWMSYMAVLVLEHHTDLVRPRPEMSFACSPYFQTEKGIRLIFLLVGTTILLLLYAQSLQWTYYLYCLIPVILWHAVLQKYRVIMSVWHYIHDHGLIVHTLAALGLGVFGLEIIVMSFRMRELLSVGLVAMSVWPLATPLRESYKIMSYGWLVSCLVLAIFPLMPVVGRDANYALVIVAGCLVVVVGLTCTLRPESRIFLSSKTDADLLQVRLLTFLQLLTACVAVYLVRSTAISRSNKQGLPFYNQIASWTILVMAFVLPMLSSTKLYTRLLNIALAFLPPYLLLSTAHESLFVLALCTLLFCWLQLEHRLNNQKPAKLMDLDFVGGGFIGQVHRHLVLADARIAFFFIFFLILAFFGTGNIASINSFDPASVYSFLTVFNPFVMGGLMMWKILIPFLFVSVIFNAIHVTVNVPTQSLILIVMLMTDFMALHFFFLVRDYGSWLDIGTSISHYIIVMSTICFMLILLFVSKIFTNFSLRLIKHKTH